MKACLLQLLLMTGLATGLAACSSGYEQKWQAAAQRRAADPYSGRWAGEWKSSRRTHHDRLECILTRNKPGQYTADFHAHWHGLSSSYTVPLPARPTRGGLHLSGEQDLGWIQGGIYKYKGVVTPQTFRMNYDSRYDTGVFELHRVPAEN